MKGKKTKRNIIVILLTVITVNLITNIIPYSTREYEFSCLYMLLYLCINEVLKEN